MENPKTIDGGLLIIFEGLDGAGKTTQIHLAEEALKQSGYLVHTSRNLGGTPIGEALRTVLFSALERPAITNFYIGVGVQEALAVDLKAKREEGAIILLDRGPMSLVAYQTFGDGVDDKLAWRYGDEGIEKYGPNQILYLKLSIKSAMNRAEARRQGSQGDYFESKPIDYFERVSKLLDVGAEKYRAIYIEADQSIEAIHEQVMDKINRLIKTKA
jgi:dTMP kinase